MRDIVAREIGWKGPRMWYRRIGWVGLAGTLVCCACGDDEGALVEVDAAAGSGPESTRPLEDGSDGGSPDASDSGGVQDPGALIDVLVQSQVGVLLDEIPIESRNELLDYLEQQEDTFWIQRARAQVWLMGYRLAYRNFFYDESEGRMQLPLPPEELWRITITSAPVVGSVDRHDVLSVDFQLSTTLLTPYESAVRAEPELGYIGGTWDEAFVLPIDPELLLQRTGYACMDEAEFPPNSVDGENVSTFFDHECEAAVDEDEVANSDCHITEHPDESCIEALERVVGKVEPLVRFTRLEWDANLADQVRHGRVTNADGADLEVMGGGLENHRIIYRYIAPDSCAIAEGCVAGPGWRRLLQFDASVHNLGAAALDIGNVDYYLENTGTVLGDHNIFQYSECHKHYHFSHYGDFVLNSADGVIGNKQAFCLQSTNRYSNNEHSPLTHPYGSCDYQGMQAGWGDDYGAGIECQWIDITGVPADTASLSFVANPDGFLCEGQPVLDEDGQLTFEPTDFKTPSGAPVDRPACDYMPEWDENNSQERAVSVPSAGGLINTACSRGQIGPLRDCGFAPAQVPQSVIECEPGTTLTLQCTVADRGRPLVLRACDYSHVLGQGVACVFREAVANQILGSGTTAFEAKCPQALDDAEPGGKLSLYTAPLLPTDEPLNVECSVTE
jgi:hypothetical protein